MLQINEMFYSLQGESSQMGRPCVFVRLTGCDLRCSYCDTKYAYDEGAWKDNEQIQDYIDQYPLAMVCITGGEPLLQQEVHALIKMLCDNGRDVMLETHGCADVRHVDPRVRKVLDIKCPSSGEFEKTRWDNLEFLQSHDEIKFVIGDRADYEFACEILKKHNLSQKVNVLFAVVFPLLKLKQLAQWVLEDQLQVQLQPQLHKIIWPDENRGR